MPPKCPKPDRICHSFLISLKSFSVSLSLGLSVCLSLSQLQGLKMIQIFRIRPHLDNANITSSSQLLQDALVV